MKEAKKRQKKSTGNKSHGIHPMREFRKVPGPKLTRRLSLDCYDKRAPLEVFDLKPPRVMVSLAQHTGPPSYSLKAKGERVRSGETVALPGENKIGAGIHASISGTITEISEATITITQGT